MADARTGPDRRLQLRRDTDGVEAETDARATDGTDAPTDAPGRDTDDVERSAALFDEMAEALRAAYDTLCEMTTDDFETGADRELRERIVWLLAKLGPTDAPATDGTDAPAPAPSQEGPTDIYKLAVAVRALTSAVQALTEPPYDAVWAHPAGRALLDRLGVDSNRWWPREAPPTGADDTP